MSVVLSPFVERYINKITELVEGEIALLWGVKGDFQKLIAKLQIIRSVLAEAENRSIQDVLVKGWLDKLRDAMYDADDIADRCMIEIGRRKHAIVLEHQMASCGPSTILGTLKFGHWVGRKIRELNKNLDGINKERWDFCLDTSSSSNKDRHPCSSYTAASQMALPDSHTVGLEDDTRRLVDALNDEEAWEDMYWRFTVFAILGSGGIGKTTLAQKVYNEQSIKGRYQLRIWLGVSKNYSISDLLKEMIRRSGGDHGQCQSKAELEALLVPLLSGRKIFLVLDDVWDARVWEDEIKLVLENSEAARDSRVLVTTRLDDVQRGMHAVHSHKMKKLSIIDGWELLCKKLELKDQDIKAGNLRFIGMEFIRRCHCLPLAIKAVAGVLNTKAKLDSEWKKVFDSNAWFTGGLLPQTVRWPLYLSYQDLPSHYKDCFLYLSLFPDGFSYSRKDLARLWVAEGYIKPQGSVLLEDLAEDCYEQLIRRNILQPDPQYPDESRCTIHHLFRELAVSLAGGENFFGSVATDEHSGTLQRTNSSSAATPKLRRLSLTSTTTEVLVLPNKVREPKCLRSLMVYNALQTKAIDKDLFRKLRHLRVLDLSWTRIQRLPYSLYHLIHLRLLDLRNTGVKELPESIGHLCSLQTLDISYCKSLCSLPHTITLLRNLRCLRLVETPVTHLPTGVRNLEKLNHLEGFVVGEQQQLQHGVCGMEELGYLSHLRFLMIYNMERAFNGVSVLAKKHKLRELTFNFTPSSPRVTMEETNKIEQTFDQLSPPNCLESLTIVNFNGRRPPSWMLPSLLSSTLPRLTMLYLHTCASWSTFPNLGQLLNLRSLTIVGASSIVSIGPEFLGFPVLEILNIMEMSNWEDWLSNGNEWMPRLKKLVIKQCPKLKSLPQGLRHVKALELLQIEEAHNLSTIQDLSASSPKTLHLVNNRNLLRISNLPALKELIIHDCTSLEYVEKPKGLQSLRLVDSSLLRLPGWVLELVELREFRLECQDHLFLKCIKDAEHWPYLKQVQMVSIVTNYGCRANLYYSKIPYSYKSNLPAV